MHRIVQNAEICGARVRTRWAVREPPLHYFNALDKTSKILDVGMQKRE